MVRSMLRKGWKTKRKLNHQEFAKKCHVTPMAVSKALGRGEAVEDAQRLLDITNPINRAYLLTDHSVMRRARAAGAQRVGGKGLTPERRAELWERERLAKIEALESSTAKNDTARLKLLGDLAERKVMEGAVALLSMSIQTHVFDRIHSMVPTMRDKFEKGAPIEEVYQYADQEAAEIVQALIRAAQSVKLPET